MFDDDDMPPPPPRLITSNTILTLHEAKQAVSQVVRSSLNHGALRVNMDKANDLLNSNSLEDFENILRMRATDRNIKDQLRENLGGGFAEGRKSRSPKSKKSCKKRNMKWVSKKSKRILSPWKECT